MYVELKRVDESFWEGKIKTSNEYVTQIRRMSIQQFSTSNSIEEVFK